MKQAMAHSELIIMIFEQREEALMARQALEIMRDQRLFGLEYATEIIRDGAGRTALHHRWELPAYPRSPHSCLPSLLSDAIFGHSEEDRQNRLADAGLDDFFLKKVTQALVPNSSALLIYIPNDGKVDARALLTALSLLKGTLHRTTVPPEVEKAIINYL